MGLAKESAPCSMKSPHPFHIHVPREPVDLWEKLRRLAAKNERKIKQEALVAIKNHLQTHGMLSDKEIERMIEAASED